MFIKYIIFIIVSNKKEIKMKVYNCIISKYLYPSKPTMVNLSPYLPDELFQEMLTWKSVSKSPYSNSLYNYKGKTWNSTKNGSKRISDHWNFESYHGTNDMHAVTNIPVPQGSWALGVYNEKKQMYIIKKIVESPAVVSNWFEQSLQEKADGTYNTELEFKKNKKIK